MIILTQIIIFTIYIIYCLIENNNKPLPSISDSWYIFNGETRNLKSLLFILFTWSIGGLLYSFNEEWFKYAGVGLFIVGTTPMFRNRIVHLFHGTAAILAVVCCFIGLIVNSIYFPVIAASFIILFLFIRDVGNKIWWAEIVAFYFIEIGLIEYSLK